MFNEAPETTAWGSVYAMAAAAAAILVGVSSLNDSTRRTVDCCGIAGVVGANRKNHDARYVALLPLSLGRTENYA